MVLDLREKWKHRPWRACKGDIIAITEEYNHIIIYNCKNINVSYPLVQTHMKKIKMIELLLGKSLGR